ncbi:succinate dehydrogenase, cytochrome b556 subunit [Rhodanobacter ginsenosidimutans]|uniref:Succinate dehydrogenase cytochrome b556 subunit n=1 Tax=Rhodanobacter ginsenosidimutans TaxID=490571 RepID=A0ABW0JU31_9GAMM
MTTARPRPRSPDIQIYRPQLTSVLSILHRMTGVVLSVGSVLLVTWMVAVAAGGDTYALADRWLRSWLGIVLLVGWTFALFYHLCNGIRHLAWDLNFGFELGSIYRSGWAVVAVSVILTVATWTFGLAGGG